MKTVIAGSRSLSLPALQKAVKLIDWPVTEAICGCAEGIDQAGWEWARSQGIRVVYFPAWEFQREWAETHRVWPEVVHYPQNGYGRDKGNGYARNAAMADYAEALLLVWDGVSKGSLNMREIAEKRGMRVKVWNALEQTNSSSTDVDEKVTPDTQIPLEL